MIDLVAFDYKKQAWVQGCEAKHLLECQLKNEIRLMESSKGKDFFKFIGLQEKHITMPRYIAELKKRLAEIQGTCCGNGGCNHETG